HLRDVAVWRPRGNGETVHPDFAALFRHEKFGLGILACPAHRVAVIRDSGHDTSREDSVLSADASFEARAALLRLEKQASRFEQLPWVPAVQRMPTIFESGADHLARPVHHQKWPRLPRRVKEEPPGLLHGLTRGAPHVDPDGAPLVGNRV